jgi:mannonate dehydratase
MSTTRRTFLGAALSAAVLGAKRPLEPLSPGIKISLQIPNQFTDDDLTFARQLGVDYVSAPTTGGTYEVFAGMKKRIEAAGLKVANIGNSNVHNMPEVSRARQEDRGVQAVSS